MKQIGGLLCAQAGQAFDQSSFGDFQWARRYPNQGEGDRFVNVAGIINDFAEGKEPPVRRFRARPPLLDTGWLRKTLKDRSRSVHLLGVHVVEVGTTDPNAGKHQWGGQSEEFITDKVRDNAKEWFGGGPNWTRSRTTTKRGNVDLGIFGKFDYEKKTTRTYEPDVRSVKNDSKTGYIGALTRKERFGWLAGIIFRRRMLVTRVNQRPFLGVTDEYKPKILQTVTDWFEKKVNGTPGGDVE
jgi:phage gpG-like protein